MAEEFSRPLYSVIVLNWNSGESVLRTVESVLTQRCRDLELLLVDNASSDGSLTMAIERFSSDSRFSTLANARNLGYCVAHNLALEKCRGRYIVTLNPDVVLEESFLDEIRTAFIAPDVGMAAPHAVRLSDKTVIDSTGTFCFPHLFATAFNAGVEGGAVPEPGEVFGVIGAYAVYDRRMLDDICLIREGRKEYFDPDFFTFFDEADLQLRARWRGWKCRYVPTARVVHGWRHSLKSGLITRAKVFHLTFRNHYLSMAKNMAWPQVIPASPSLLLHEAALVIISIFCLRPVFFSTKIDALRLLPRMLPKREFIMQNRRIGVREFNSALTGFGGFIRFLLSVLISERRKGKLLSFSDHQN